MLVIQYSTKLKERQVVENNLQMIFLWVQILASLKPLFLSLFSYLSTEISVSDILIFNILAEYLLKYHKKVKNLSLFFVCVESMVNQKILILPTIILFSD